MQHCFFCVSIAGASPKTIVLQLSPECPITANNFLQICKSKSTAKRPPYSGGKATPTQDAVLEPTYRGTEIHRVIPNFMIQGGDFTSFDGKGGYAHPSTNSGKQTFADENFIISHASEGILSMANRGKNTNGSQFFITLNKCLHLDGKHVAFGKVVKGIEVVREISKVETEGERPVRMQRVLIVDCGEGWGREERDDDDSSSASSRQKNKKRKKHHKHHHEEKKHRKHKRSKRDDTEYNSSDGSRSHKKKKREKYKSKSKHRKRERSDS
eukprot:scaffold28511_cov71-Cyclotella_meneghiniana.AAC.4